MDDKTGPIKIVGSLESFIVRLEDEYNKSLQQINPHTQVRITHELNNIKPESCEGNEQQRAEGGKIWLRAPQYTII